MLIPSTPPGALNSQPLRRPEFWPGCIPPPLASWRHVTKAGQAGVTSSLLTRVETEAQKPGTTH